jgi:ABC-type transport system involved in Fe-S cluster assembly fused permease/ATPase subunit
MARVILDVPSEKMGSFIRAIMQLGIDKHSISSEKEREVTETSRPERESLFSGKGFKNFTAKLFDWDRNRNELEFE